MPYGETKEMFFKGISTPRNKALMRILNDLDYSEQTGHGILDVIDVYGKEVFDINVILPFDKDVLSSKRINEPVNEIEKLIIKAMRDDASITYSKLTLQLNKGRTTIL